MKKILLAFLGLSLILALGCESTPNNTDSEYEKKFFAVLDSMQEYVLIPPSKVGDEDLTRYVSYYNAATYLIKNGSVKLEFTDEKKMVNGLEFVVGKDFKSSKLVISRPFIDTFNTKYAFHMAVISREVATVHYAKNGGGFFLKDDYYEQGRYTADPYYPTAKFIQELFVAKKCKLTSYENDILTSSKDTFFDKALYNYEMIHYPAFRFAFNAFKDGIEGDESSFDLFNTEVIKLIACFNVAKESDAKYYYHTALISCYKFYNYFAPHLTTAQKQKVAAVVSQLKQIVEKHKGETLERFAQMIKAYDSLAMQEISR